MGLFSESKRAKLIRAYRELFDSDAGKEVLHDLCKSCHVYHSTMDPNPQELAYKEGERSVVLRILRTLEINPHELDRKLRDHQDE